MKNYDSKTSTYDRDEKMNEMLYHAYRCLNANEMLIQQCDGWLSAEEGNKNLMKAIEDRERAKRKKVLTGILCRIFRIFRIIKRKGDGQSK